MDSLGPDQSVAAFLKPWQRQTSSQNEFERSGFEVKSWFRTLDYGFWVSGTMLFPSCMAGDQCVNWGVRAVGLTWGSGFNYSSGCLGLHGLKVMFGLGLGVRVQGLRLKA